MFKQLVKSKKKKSGQRGGFNILDFQLRDESKGDVNPPAHTSNVPTVAVSVHSGDMENWEGGIILVFFLYSCYFFVRVVTYPICYFLPIPTSRNEGHDDLIPEPQPVDLAPQPQVHEGDTVENGRSSLVIEAEEVVPGEGDDDGSPEVPPSPSTPA